MSKAKQPSPADPAATPSILQALLSDITALTDKRRAQRPGELLGVVIECLEQGDDADAREYQRLVKAAAAAKRKSHAAGMKQRLAADKAMTAAERREWHGADEAIPRRAEDYTY